MAHFAELDENNIVLQCVVVANEEIVDGRFASGESEQKGIDFLNELFPDSGTWVQTSFNHNFRGNYGSIGMYYDDSLDVFYEPQPYPSFVLDDTEFVWEAPAEPITGYGWNEDTLSWVRPEPPLPSWTEWDPERGQYLPPGGYPDDMDTVAYDWDEDTESWIMIE